MKWFEHDTDAHTDLKIQALLSEFGGEGYACYFICLELIGKEGRNFQLNGNLDWKKTLCKTIYNDSCKDILKVDKMLAFMGDRNLICRKSLKKGILYAPKLKTRADEYTKKLQRKSGQSPDNIGILSSYNTLHNITIQDITRQYITKLKELKGYASMENWDKLYFARHIKASKELAIVSIGLTNDHNTGLEAMQWMSDTFAKKNLEWTIETVVRWLPEFVKTGRKSEQLKKLEEAINASKNRERDR